MYIDLYILVFFFSYSLFFSEGWLHGRRRWRNATGRRPPGRFSCPVAAPRIKNAPNPCSIFHFLLILNESAISHTTVSFASLHVYLNCMCWRISSIPLPITKTRTLRLISLHSLVCGVCIFSLCFPCCNPLLCFLSTCRCIVAVDLLPRRTLVLPPTLGVVAAAAAVAKALPGALALLWTLIVHKRVLNSRRKRLHLLPLLQLPTMELLTCECVIPNFVVRPWEELLLQPLLTRVPLRVPQEGN